MIFSSFIVLTNFKIRYCPSAQERIIAVKRAISFSGEFRPPVKEAIFTIDVATVRASTIKEIKMKRPFGPRFKPVRVNLLGNFFILDLLIPAFQLLSNW
jgi:hypothetical protein